MIGHPAAPHDFIVGEIDPAGPLCATCGGSRPDPRHYCLCNDAERCVMHRLTLSAEQAEGVARFIANLDDPFAENLIEELMRRCPHPSFVWVSAGPTCTICGILETCQQCGEPHPGDHDPFTCTVEEQPCNRCEALSGFAPRNAAGYCRECMGEAEGALENRLQGGEIDQAAYDAEFAALHAEQVRAACAPRRCRWAD